jgi:hypothetical protein
MSKLDQLYTTRADSDHVLMLAVDGKDKVSHAIPELEHQARTLNQIRPKDITTIFMFMDFE